MDIQTHWSRLEKIARYRTAQRSLRACGWGSIAFGGIAVALGSVPPGDGVMLFAGATLLGTGIWTLLSPRPAGVLLEAFSLAMVGAFNVLGAALELRSGAAGLSASFWMRMGIAQIAWSGVGAARFARFRKAFRDPPTDAEQDQLDEVVRGIQSARMDSDSETIEFTTRGLSAEMWKARLLPDGAVFVAAGGETRAAGREAIEFTPGDRKGLGRWIEFRCVIGGRKLNGTIAPEHLDRLQLWKTGIILPLERAA